MRAPMAWVNAQELNRLIFGTGAICPICGKRFVQRKASHIYCTDECWNDMYCKKKRMARARKKLEEKKWQEHESAVRKKAR